MKRVKTSTDSTKRNQVNAAVLSELINVQYVNKVAVDVYGKIYYLDEAHVRALQVVAAKLAATNKEAFEDFKKNVIVYSGRDITHSNHVMYWQDNGKFVQTFQRGFYTADDNLTEELYNLTEELYNV